MSEHAQILAYFPGVGGIKWLIDITKIEAIGQSSERETATIFTAARSYQIYVEDPMGNNDADAMGYITMQIALASESAAQAEDEESPDGTILVPESDCEDDFDLEDFVEVDRPAHDPVAPDKETFRQRDREYFDLLGRSVMYESQVWEIAEYYVGEGNRQWFRLSRPDLIDAVGVARTQFEVLPDEVPCYQRDCKRPECNN